MPITNRVRELRKKRGLSFEQLAVAAKLSGKTVLNVERGKEPLLSTCRSIAEALGVRVEVAFPPETK